MARPRSPGSLISATRERRWSLRRGTVSGRRLGATPLGRTALVSPVRGTSRPARRTLVDSRSERAATGGRSRCQPKPPAPTVERHADPATTSGLWRCQWAWRTATTWVAADGSARRSTNSSRSRTCRRTLCPRWTGTSAPRRMRPYTVLRDTPRSRAPSSTVTSSGGAGGAGTSAFRGRRTMTVRPVGAGRGPRLVRAARAVVVDGVVVTDPLRRLAPFVCPGAAE